MSQIVNAIKFFDTGHRKLIRKGIYTPLFEDVTNITSEYRQDYTIGKVYKIDVCLGSTCLVDDSDFTKKHEAVERTKSQVIEAIFGEFRQHFRRLEKAIYDQDYNLAAKILYEFEERMYSTKMKD